MLKIIKEFSYLYEIVDAVKHMRAVPINEFNEVGGRKSAKSVSYQILYALLSQFPYVGLFGSRASKQGEADFFQDFCETFDLCGLKYFPNKSKSIIRFPNGNKLYIRGLNSQANMSAKIAGFPKFANVKYIFKYYEERFEFSTKDYQAVQEAVRGIGDTDIQVTTMNVCNPWAKSNPYIDYCNKNSPWDINKMKTTGSQFKIIETTDPETKISTRKLFHYTNWRVAKDVLSKSEIAEIKRTWEIDRNRAQTVDWGMPGYEWGAIYTHLLDKIAPAIINPDPQWIVAGLDYGWSKDITGGKTAAIFGTASLNTGIDILYEFVQDPAVKPLGTDQIADLVVQFYLDSMKDFCARLGRTVPFQCKVKVDNMAIGVITLLNQSARKFRVDNWLSFHKCVKFPIVDRIDIQQAIMSANMFRVSSNCLYLIRDLEQAHYKEELEKRDRAKGNDHVLNAYEYGIESCMYAFARNLNPEKKYKNRGGIW